MKIFLTGLCLVFIIAVHAQDTIPLSASGEKLCDFYLKMDVEANWLSGHHVVWDTGQPDMPQSIHGNKTHCSAFAAAACKKAGVYLLCPPQHGQVLLANAQYKWLQTGEALANGWQELKDTSRYQDAQQSANNGSIVIAIYQNTDSSKPGHTALIMPTERSLALLQNEGPECIMAGIHNHNYISLKNAFSNHIQSWPENEIRFFVQDKTPQLNDP